MEYWQKEKAQVLMINFGTNVKAVRKKEKNCFKIIQATYR